MSICPFKSTGGLCIPPGESTGYRCSFLGTDPVSSCAVYPLHAAKMSGKKLSTQTYLEMAYSRGLAQEAANRSGEEHCHLNPKFEITIDSPQSDTAQTSADEAREEMHQIIGTFIGIFVIVSVISLLIVVYNLLKTTFEYTQLKTTEFFNGRLILFCIGISIGSIVIAGIIYMLYELYYCKYIYNSTAAVQKRKKKYDDELAKKKKVYYSAIARELACDGEFIPPDWDKFAQSRIVKMQQGGKDAIAALVLVIMDYRGEYKNCSARCGMVEALAKIDPEYALPKLRTIINHRTEVGEYEWIRSTAIKEKNKILKKPSNDGE